MEKIRDIGIYYLMETIKFILDILWIIIKFIISNLYKVFEYSIDFIRYFKKKSYETQIIFGIIFILVILILIAIGTHPSNIEFYDFCKDNLLPELIGVFIELLIVMFIFNKYQSKESHKKKIDIEKRLREYLIFFSRNGLSGLPDEYKIGDFYGENHTKNQEELNKLIEYINLLSDDSNQLLEVAKEHLIIDKSAIENLLSVASSLSENHFKAWIRIIYFINKLENQIEFDDLKVIIIEILKNMQKYDKASYDNNMYVGARSN